MKRIIALVLSFVFVFSSLVGCGKNKKQDVKIEYKKAYILVDTSSQLYIDFAAEFKKTFENLVGTVDIDAVNNQTKDYSSFVKKVIEDEYDVFYLPNSADVTKKILKSAIKQKVSCPIIVENYEQDNTISKFIKDTELNVYTISLFDEEYSGNEQTKKFVTGFKKYLSKSSNEKLNGGNSIISFNSAIGFDSYNMAFSAIKDVANEKGAELYSSNIANALWNIEYKNSVFGLTKFDVFGNLVNDGYYIEKVENGKQNFLKKQTADNLISAGMAPDFESLMGTKLNTETKEIVIGISLPDNKIGNQTKLGIDYANSIKNSITISGEKYKIKLIFSKIDDTEESKIAAANSFVNDGVLLVIGSFDLDSSIDTASVFENANVLAIDTAYSQKTQTQRHNWYLRMGYINTFEGTVLAKFARQDLLKNQ